jgi:hypothetical protein
MRRQRVHVFEGLRFHGTPRETEEMLPQWYPESDIPYSKMWADDKYWLPLFLAGKRFDGVFAFDDESSIIEYQLDEVKD